MSTLPCHPLGPSVKKMYFKKQIFSLDLHPNLLGLFNKSVIFPKFSIQIFQSITNQSLLNFQEKNLRQILKYKKMLKLQKRCFSCYIINLLCLNNCFNAKNWNQSSKKIRIYILLTLKVLSGC
jgi:hypothetical protein